MGRRRRILLASLVVVAVGLVWLLIPSSQPEPVYEGHPVSYWVSHFDFNGMPSMDSNAVPFLVRALETHDGLLHHAYRNVWPSMPIWIKSHLPEPVETWPERVSAIFLLADVRNDAKPAIPAVIRAMRWDKEAVVRDFATQLLGKIGSDDKRATDVLVEALKDKNPLVRGTAADALAGIGRNDPRVTHVLVEALKDKDPLVRVTAAESLEVIDPEAAAKAGVK